MVKKIIKYIILTFFAIMLSVLLIIAGVYISSRPKTTMYISGSINGSFVEMLNSRFSFKTYDNNWNEIRSEIINIFLMNKFNIEYTENERYIIFYTSFHESESEISTVLENAILEPKGPLDLKYLNKHKIYFSFNTIFMENKSSVK